MTQIIDFVDRKTKQARASKTVDDMELRVIAAILLSVREARAGGGNSVSMVLSTVAVKVYITGGVEQRLHNAGIQTFMPEPKILVAYWETPNGAA